MTHITINRYLTAVKYKYGLLMPDTWERPVGFLAQCWYMLSVYILVRTISIVTSR